jgi:hypothetical protein
MVNTVGNGTYSRRGTNYVFNRIGLIKIRERRNKNEYTEK